METNTNNQTVSEKKKRKRNSFAHNTGYSIASQLLSLAISFIMGFLLPRYLDEYQYAYKQVFALYIGYLGVLHFGLLDGIMLRYAQYDYDELDKPRLRSQFCILLTGTTLICVYCCFVAALVLSGVARQLVILIAVSAITKNVFTYTSYAYQITNQIGRYSLLVIAQRITYAVIIVSLLFFRVGTYTWYCIAELCGDLVGILIGCCLNRQLFFGRTLPPRPALAEAWKNVSSGFFLMVANFSSILLVGSARMVIQWRWDDLVFGKTSFSFVLTSLFLTFVSAISVVLFPSLKRMDADDLPKLYYKIRTAFSPILFTLLIGFFPLCLILRMWLPKYTDSLYYLAFLLPLIVFTSKAGLLTDNYLKAYRKERLMLLINLATIVLGICMFLLCAYVADNLILLLLAVVLAVMVRSVLSEIAVMKVIGKVRITEFFLDFLMTAAFIASAHFFRLWVGCLVYAGCLILYLFVYRKPLISVFGQFRDRFRRGRQNASVPNPQGDAAPERQSADAEQNDASHRNGSSENETQN